jgi:hypothetical protein
MDIENASAFRLAANGTIYQPQLPAMRSVRSIPGDPKPLYLLYTQVQAYVASGPPTPGTDQITTITFSDYYVVAGIPYILEFRGEDGVAHTVSYTSLPSDGLPDIMQGLLDAINAAKATDSFFEIVFGSIVGNTMNFQTSRRVSLDATLGLAGASLYWELRQFPLALVEQVVRGASADALKEDGRSDVGMAEEQLMPTEAAVRAAVVTGKQYLPLADQQAQDSRYAVK